MNKRQITFPYPADLPEALGQAPEEFEGELRFLVAAKLYEMGRISSGRAAELAGVEGVEFLDRLGRYRIPVKRSSRICAVVSVARSFSFHPEARTELSESVRY